MCQGNYADLRNLNLENYKDKEVPIGISNRHIHLSQADLETLFGAGHELTAIKDLSQPGQYACDEVLDVVGPKGTINKVRVLGPVRPETQVELAQTDARKIGVKAALRESGVLDGSEGCKLVGPAGEVELAKGCIVAHLHIHFHTDEAAAMGIKDHQVLTVLVKGAKTVVFCDVIARVGDKMKLDFHLDTDEANAALVGKDAKAYILG